MASGHTLSRYSISHSALNAFYFCTLHLFFTVRSFSNSDIPIKLRCDAMQCTLFSVTCDCTANSFQLKFKSNYILCSPNIFPKKVFIAKILVSNGIHHVIKRVCDALLLFRFFPFENAIYTQCTVKVEWKKWCSFHTLIWVENTFSHFHETVFIYIACFIVVEQTRAEIEHEMEWREKKWSLSWKTKLVHSFNVYYGSLKWFRVAQIGSDFS